MKNESWDWGTIERKSESQIVEDFNILCEAFDERAKRGYSYDALLLYNALVLLHGHCKDVFGRTLKMPLLPTAWRPEWEKEKLRILKEGKREGLDPRVFDEVFESGSRSDA